MSDEVNNVENEVTETPETGTTEPEVIPGEGTETPTDPDVNPDDNTENPEGGENTDGEGTGGTTEGEGGSNTEGSVDVSGLTGLLANSTASSVKGFHVNRAIEFYHKEDIFFALACEEPWPTENVPGPEFYDELKGVWGYKRVETKYLVVPDDENGTVLFQNKKFRIVQDINAMAEGARWLYMMSYINFDELPFKTYHQIGIKTGLKVDPNANITSFALLPEQVADPGITEIINNRRGVGREPDMREQISIVIEF